MALADTIATLAGGKTPSMFDPIAASRFWLYDVAPIDALSLPIFQPLSGFTNITAPEITVETATIQEGNNPFPHLVAKGASVGVISLSRGVTFYNSDFYNWIHAAVLGTTGSIDVTRSVGAIGGIGGITYRRSLMLIHFFRNFGAGAPTANTAQRRTVAAVGAAVTGVGMSAAAGVLLGTSQGVGVGVGAGIASTLQLGSLYGASAISSMRHNQNAVGAGGGYVKVPARAFLLHKCIPVRYKTGSDFDASSSEISIQELDLDVERVEEISLAAV